MGVETSTQAISLIAGTEKTDEEKQADQQAQEDANCCTGCFVWCQTSATCGERCQFTLWVICAILSPIFYGMYQNTAEKGEHIINWGYILLCALSIVMFMMASANFGDIAEFREVVEALREGTDQLIEQREKIRGEVSELQEVQFKLNQLEKEHSVSNAQLRTQLRQYEQWYPDTLSRSSEAQRQTTQIKEQLEISNERISRNVIRAEIDMLYKALDAFEKRDDKEIGLNRTEYTQFVNVLPQRYKTRIEESKKGFDDFCGADMIMDREEFKLFLEELVLSEVEDLAKGLGINMPVVQDLFTELNPDTTQDDEIKTEV